MIQLFKATHLDGTECSEEEYEMISWVLLGMVLLPFIAATGCAAALLKRAGVVI